ncbi:O-methylsterigmatocystin oxidoreductase Short=OMST oxidoreductase [Rhizoctonia solani AG-1 IB]|uniref:O-methylsterigmatocystin oxidoreductase Short=OMST oxidoreductase n=1 Tax=Thanatephorus cucumeris (strain AG1-IB / isolate 7/3/14) TaxID=1108050 RepID=M5C007_THACB|nr:O-methylsterigmatocystin oxidoreductase Short=OMST oxidoreductase [Rhizoctonia solani AG-1 IB]
MRQNNIEHASYTSKLLQAKGGIDASPEDIDLVKWTAGAMYLAGSSTTTHVIMVFFLMMALYPEVARRAQEEIDTVVGRGRIPDFPDRELLPYVEALLQEVMRISPPSALGLPHTALEDIDFQGYRIPKNTTIHPNIWGMLHDPAYYSSPYEFLPDRYLKSAPDPDPRKYIFGFGEDLNKRVEEIGGRESPQTYKLFDGYGASSPLPFKYKITVRDEGAALLLEQISLLS